MFSLSTEEEHSSTDLGLLWPLTEKGRLKITKLDWRLGCHHNLCVCVTSGMQQIKQLLARLRSKQIQAMITNFQVCLPRKRLCDELINNVGPKVRSEELQKERVCRSPCPGSLPLFIPFSSGFSLCHFYIKFLPVPFQFGEPLKITRSLCVRVYKISSKVIFKILGLSQYLRSF